MSTADHEWDVLPYVGAGPLRFGMSTEEVESQLGPPTGLVPKGTDEETVTSYDDLGLFVYVEEGRGCAALEMWGSVLPVLLGHHLLNEPFAALRDWFESADDEVELRTDGLRSTKFGVSLSVPAIKDPNAQTDGVLAFRRGYWD